MCVCVHVCVCVCTCIHIYEYIYTHQYIYTHTRMSIYRIRLLVDKHTLRVCENDGTHTAPAQTHTLQEALM